MEWRITKTEGPHQRPCEWRCGEIIIRTGTTRGGYPMTKWRVIFPDGKEASGRNLEQAMRYGELYLTTLEASNRMAQPDEINLITKDRLET